MHSLPSLSQPPKRTRITLLIFASLLWAGASFQPARAADNMSASAPSNAGRGFFGTLFGRSTADKYAVPHGGANRLHRSILALPLGIFRSVGTGFSKVVKKP